MNINEVILTPPRSLSPSYAPEEAGKRSASRLLLPQATDAVAGSSYRKQKKPSTKGPPPKNQDTCTYCGTKGHGKKPPTKIRRTECPALGTKCNHCGKDHHFEKVCWNKEPMKNAGHEDAISDALCEITSTDKAKGITLDHHVFDQSTQKMVTRRGCGLPDRCSPVAGCMVGIGTVSSTSHSTTKAIICQCDGRHRMSELPSWY